MILDIGKEFEVGEISYKVTSLLHGDKGGYREEYCAIACAKNNATSTVRLIAYKQPDTKKQVCAHSIGVAEAKLSQKLCGSAFDEYCTYFEALSDDEKPLLVIVTNMTDAITLREAIAKEDIGKIELWSVFTDVVVGLNEISHVTTGGCHFGITPDNIYVYRDANMELHAIIRALNLVCDDFEKNQNLDKSQVSAQYRAPETHVRMFGPKSMQWSLALLLTFMLQRVHPWGLISDTNAFQCYSRLRHNKPQIIYGEGLENVLLKALSINPAQRYDEVDDFIADAMKYSKMPMPASYECFGKPTAEKPNLSPSLSTIADNGEGTDALQDTSADASKGLKANVKITAERGEGLAAVAGMDELKEELRRDFIDIVANRKLATQYDIYPPGMLFYGPPGCGKTYLAEHLARESELEYSIVNPSDLGSIYIHGSQKMIADLFSNAEAKAKRNGKGVLLIFDEVESMLPSRQSESNESQAGEVAEFLTRLNNSSKRGVYVIGLTNCLDKIDKAVLRKGRLDRVIYIDLPDIAARKSLFEYELSKRPHITDVDIEHLAIITDGYTSSDIAYIVAESARVMFAATLRKKSSAAICIDQTVLEDVISKTHPSVTLSDRMHYEDMRLQYASGGKKSRPSVGFAVGI